MKKAIILGGSYYHHNLLYSHNKKFLPMFDESIYIPKLHSTDLTAFDCVFLASRLNTKFLVLNSQKLLDYLENGGNLVILGGIEDNFLPHLDYKESEVNFWWWIHEGADLPLFAFDSKQNFWDFINIKECKWHYHGTFKVSKECQRILINEIGENILYKDNFHFKGALYASSLDPDFHIGQGFMPVTIPFFEKFIRWIDFDIKAHK
ncbi:hypothetical protein OQH60_06970 [Campylobacter sp. MIT 21-1685]|uniref:hypothetical protein n=1 Tax=unclassified Campylobacter TaxID=2593542 RepID=UPI00224B59B4|nr:MULTISPECIES: hypothetical protein [unclassified Campylobacter]MCX2683606.1 hypothetical protein [Campylobacter sp. MIT 21-1684]MCX2751889.1 hypothetical protein [Campylobacter sp. MIT 21-1682]MCX2808090.1 hypothetical protein [Campylobacter sp. MIT 21-1685]